MTVLWIILGVIAALITVIVILLHFSVKAYIRADRSGLDINVKYLGIKLYSLSLPDKGGKDDAKADGGAEQPPGKPEIVLTELDEADSTEAPIADTHAQVDPPADDENKPQKPEKSGEDKPKEAESAENDENDEKAENDEDKPKEIKPTLLEQFNEYKKYIPAGKKAFKKLLKLIRFYDLKLDMTVGNEDPYKAGMNFGKINAAVYSAIGLLCCIFSVKIDSTEIKCDYENKRFDIDFYAAVYVRPSAVIALAAYVGVYYLKIRKSMKKLDKLAKEKATNE